ncbi:MAG: NADH-quinone oxidoreductase subunit C [Anaerolineae bacterium]|nr:NADH-quinone oxidoreductase subunit C [Anaerolineae bacterium]
MSNTEATITVEVPARWQDAVPGAVLSEDANSVVVAPESLVALCTYLRDHEGYDYLSNVTGVDYLNFKGRDASNRFEVVYHLYSTRGAVALLC